MSTADIGTTLRRLRAMGPAEFVVRGRQELAKRLERIGVMVNLDARSDSILNEPSFSNTPDAAVDPTRTGDRGAAARESFDRFAEIAASRFFVGALNERTCLSLGDRLPGLRAQVVAHADDIGQGRFDLLGFHDSGRRSRTGVKSIRSMPPAWATARSSGNLIATSGSSAWVRHIALPEMNAMRVFSRRWCDSGWGPALPAWGSIGPVAWRCRRV